MDELRVGMSDSEVLAHYCQAYPYIPEASQGGLPNLVEVPASWCSRGEQAAGGRRR
jgi:hypothetical protein